MYLNYEYLQELATRFALSYIPFAAKAPALQNMLAVAVLVVLSVLASPVRFCMIEHPFLELRGIVLRRKPHVQGALPVGQPVW